MFFNQVPIPKTYSKESLEIASHETIPHCFFKLCQDRPDEKMVLWKDEKGDFSNYLSNSDVLNYAYFFTSLFKSEKPKIAIMCSNNPIMLPLELSSWLSQGQSISVYDTDTIETVIFKLNLSKTNIFACDKKAFDLIKNENIKENTKINQIFLLEKCDIPENFEKENDIIVNKLWPSEIKTESTFNKTDISKKLEKIKASDVAKIIFTSGTTGNPKLIPLSHNNFLVTLRGWIKLMKFNKGHKIPSYLPNAHVFQSAALYLGFLGVFQNHITTKNDLGNDLKKIKPNGVIAVPLVLDVFREKIIEKLETFPFLKTALQIF